MDPRSRSRRASAKDHQNNNRVKFDVGYDGNHILKVKTGCCSDVDFSDEPLCDVAYEKQFVFSLFYEYIKYNVVRISDLAVMYKEISQDLRLKDLDILAFLMETDKFEFVEDDVSTQKSSHKSKTTQPNHEKESLQKSRQKLTSKPCPEIDCQPDLDSTIDILNNAYDTLLYDDEDGLRFEENSQTLTPSIESDDKRQDCDQSSTTSHADDPSLFEKLYSEEKSKSERLQKEIDELKKEMKRTKERMSEKCFALEKEIECKDEQLERYESEMNVLAEKIDEVAQFKIKYEDLLKERLILKQEIVDLFSVNKILQEKVENQSLMPKSKKEEIVNLFREEYKILKERIDCEWKERLEKQLEQSRKSLETQVYFKVELMKICLNYQYIGNKYLIAGHVAQCYTALELLTGVNNWMEKTMGFPVVTDTTEWISRLNFLQKVEAEQQTEYTKLMTCLKSESTPKLQLFDITLKKPEFPTPPHQTLGTIIRNVMTALYNDQRAIIQHLTRESMSQRITQTRALPYEFTPNSSYGLRDGLSQIPRAQSLDSAKLFVQALQTTGISHPYVQQQYQEKDDSSSTLSMVTCHSSMGGSAPGSAVGEERLSRDELFPAEESNSIGKVILGRGTESCTVGNAIRKSVERDCTEIYDDSADMWNRLASQIDDFQ